MSIPNALTGIDLWLRPHGKLGFQIGAEATAKHILEVHRLVHVVETVADWPLTRLPLS
jgi:hypothetical protein